jgi:hypothetical protein
MLEKLWIWLAWSVPRPLAYWCAIRVGVHATTYWPDLAPSQISLPAALTAWNHPTETRHTTTHPTGNFPT